MVLGSLLAWTLIRLSQQTDATLTTVDVLWCVALPVLDTLAVMIRRLGERRSPFKPDRGHIHHLLLDAGIGPRGALAVLVTLAIVFACIGAQTRQLTPGSNLLSFGTLAVIYIATHRSVRRYQQARVAGSVTSEATLPIGTTEAVRSRPLRTDGRQKPERVHARKAAAARAARVRKIVP